MASESFIPQRTFPYALVQYDTEREELVRDSDGLCVEVPRGKTKHTEQQKVVVRIEGGVYSAF